MLTFIMISEALVIGFCVVAPNDIGNLSLGSPDALLDLPSCFNNEHRLRIVETYHPALLVGSGSLRCSITTLNLRFYLCKMQIVSS